MKKNHNLTNILTTIVCLIPIFAALMMYKKLPDQIVTHWDGAGNPNGYSSKFVGTIVLPGILVILNLLYPYLVKMDPKYKNMSEKLINICHWLIPMIALFASGITLAAAIGYDVKVQFYGPVLMGFIFIIIGNYLPKTKQSYTMGIKLPWTLNDEENWEKTHRMAGFLWVVCGLLILICTFLPGNSSTYVFGLAIVMVLVPCIYSYLLYAKKNKMQ